ncbi:MAG: histidine kinase [Bacteroidetes bacterium]|nr:histidine kinase [Bacteroidota bacterium]MBS1539209.1 histidine kinase [Bacteroidota bacterium]
MKDFRIRVLIRVALLGLSMALFVFMLSHPYMFFAAGLNLVVIVLQLLELYRFVSLTNRKLTRFLESVRYSDFISGFTADNKLGKSFKNLNTAFNEVFEAFRKARSEKEEHWQYLNTIVQQVRTGIISFDAEGNVQLMNANAKRFANEANLKNIHDLAAKNKKLYLALMEVQSGKSTLYKTNDFLLTLQATELRMHGSLIKIITLQNIQTELQRQELEAWQNLTRVLRHEIMNSITPISSLTSTLREILSHELIKKDDSFQINADTADDLKEGLATIEGRSKGLIKFIDAYREYTSLPQPKFKTILLKELIEHTAQLMRQELKKTTIQFTALCESEYLTIQADAEMIEQVLINLVKNAMEALADKEYGKIELTGKYTGTHVVVEVADNGPGIIPEAIHRIFVPFFTTKKSGSGIGLALSRQIMQMHNGSLTVESTPDVKTVFTLRF